MHSNWLILKKQLQEIINRQHIQYAHIMLCNWGDKVLANIQMLANMLLGTDKAWAFRLGSLK